MRCRVDFSFFLTPPSRLFCYLARRSLQVESFSSSFSWLVAKFWAENIFSSFSCVNALSCEQRLNVINYTYSSWFLHDNIRWWFGDFWSVCQALLAFEVSLIPAASSSSSLRAVALILDWGLKPIIVLVAINNLRFSGALSKETSRFICYSISIFPQ